MLSALSDWYLCGVAESGEARAVVRVDREPFVIGRRPGLNLTLDSLCVSGRHAELCTRGDRLFVADLGSRNGTLVNGKRIRKAPLGIGDLLKVGDVEFRLDRRPRHEAKPRNAPAAGDQNSLQRRWLATQFAELTRETVLAAALNPIVQLPDETVVAYEACGQSLIAGLETEARMHDAARLLGREKELSRLLLHCCEQAAPRVPPGCWLLFRAPAAVNLESEMAPLLDSLRQQAPHGRIVVEVQDAPSRSVRSLTDFVAALKRLGMQLAIGNFACEHIRFLQTSRVLPLAVRLDTGLTRNLAQKSEPERRRLRTLVAVLHQYRIQSVAQDVETREDLHACCELEIDFACGAVFGEPLAAPDPVMPETCVLTSSALSALSASPAEGEAGGPPATDAPVEAVTGPPESLPDTPCASVLEDDMTLDLLGSFGSASFRLPPPTR